MRMQIDFYSKDELAIQIDFSGRYPFPENETSELFLFTCFTLRQLSNLGQHPAAKALAGLLVSKSTITSLFEGVNELPSGKQLLYYLKIHAMSLVSQTQGVKASFNLSIALDNQLNFNDALMQALDREIIAKVPKIVKFKGNGKKSFLVTLPPFLMKMNGFGIFGSDVNHHAFHSVSALIRFLGKKYRGNKAFLDHLIEVAQRCGTAYIFNQIPSDQVALANAILKQVGIS